MLETILVVCFAVLLLPGSESLWSSSTSDCLQEAEANESMRFQRKPSTVLLQGLPLMMIMVLSTNHLSKKLRVHTLDW